MPTRLLPAVVSATALTLVGFAVPAGSAAAASCAPVIDPSSVSYTPDTLVIGAKGKARRSTSKRRPR